MVDWSVLGEVEITGSGDDYIDSLARSIQSLSNDSKEAAAGAESMEKGIDSATEAVAKLSQSSDRADDTLEKVEEELEDIVTDAGAASGSVSVLSTMLETVDDIDDIDIDIDKEEISSVDDLLTQITRKSDNVGDVVDELFQNIDGIEDLDVDVDTDPDAIENIKESYQEMRVEEQTGDRPIIPQRAAGLPIDYRESMKPMEGIGDEFSEIDAIQQRIDEESGTGPRPFRQLPEAFGDEKATRSNIIDALNFSDDDRELRQGPMQVGRLLSGTDERTASKIAGSIASIDQVADSQKEVLQKINEAEIVTGDESDDDTDVDTGRDNEFTVFTEEAAEAMRKFNNSVDDVDESTISRQKVREIGVPSVSTVRSRDAERLSDDIPTGGLRNNVTVMRSAAAMDVADNKAKGLRNRLAGLSAAATSANTTLGFSVAALASFSGAAKTAEEAADDMNEEIDDLVGSLYALAPALNTVSANLGPFNIGFTNLLITLPVLLAVLGPLVATIGALAAGLVAVGAAFAGLLAVGAIGFVEKLKENFASIETTGDALTAIFNGLKDAVMEALQPLEEVTIGGLGPTEIFVTLMQDLVTMLHMFAEAAAMLLGLEEVQSLLLNLRAAFLGLEDGPTSGMSMMESLRILAESAIPVLEDFLVYLVDVLPEAIAFFARITEQIAPALAAVSSALINFARVMTEVGTGALQFIIPALVTLLEVISLVFDLLLALDSMLGDVSNILFTLAGVFLLVTAATIKFAAGLRSAIAFQTQFVNGIAEVNDSVKEGQNAFEAFNSILDGTDSKLVAALQSITVYAAGIIILVAGIYLVLDALGFLQPALDLLNATFGTAVDVVNDVMSAIEGLGPAGQMLTRMLELIAGAALIAFGAQVLLSGSLVGTTISAYGLVKSITLATFALTQFQAVLAGGILAGIFAMAAGLIYIAENGGIVETIIIGVAAAIGVATTALYALITGLSALRIALVSTGIGAIIVGIGVAIVFVMNNWEAFVNLFTGSLGVISNALSPIVAMIQTILNPDSQKSWWEALTDGLDEIGAAAKITLAALVGLLAPFGVIGGTLLLIYEGVKWIQNHLPTPANIMRGLNTAIDTAQDNLLGENGAQNAVNDIRQAPLTVGGGEEEQRVTTQPTASSTEQNRQTNVQVNLENNGRQNMDYRDAREFAEVVNTVLNNNRRKEQGRDII